MVGYNGLDISHTAVAQFKLVPVENVMKWV